MVGHHETTKMRVTIACVHMLYLYDCQVIPWAGILHMSRPCSHLHSQDFSGSFLRFPDDDSSRLAGRFKGVEPSPHESRARQRILTCFTYQYRLPLRTLDHQAHALLISCGTCLLSLWKSSDHS